MFWYNLYTTSPQYSNGVPLTPGCQIAKMLTEQYGSVEEFVSFFKNEAATMKDSEWAWLVYNNKSKLLEFVATKTSQNLN